MNGFNTDELTNITDNQILKAFQSGGKLEESVLSHLMNAYKGLFYKGKNRYGLDESMAQDAYTDAFLALRQQLKANRFRKESQISTYFYQIFCNKCADQKKKSQTKHNNTTLAMALDIPAAAQNAFHELVRQEDFELLKRLIRKLKPKCKQLLWESEYLGFSASEMAKRLGLKDAKSVKSQKYRCMERLRKSWGIQK